MNPQDKADLDAAVFRQTAADPVWLGYWLARHQQTEQLDAQQLAAKLGTAMDKLVLLCLCRTPRADHFREDVRVVCERTGAREEVLAQLLRQEQALEQWTAAETPQATGWLMAASDRPADEDDLPGKARDT